MRSRHKIDSFGLEKVGMKAKYHSLETVWEYLEASGALGPTVSALLAMLLIGGAMLLGVWFYVSYKKFRIRGGFSGVRTRKKVKTLRAHGQLEGEFTFADAIEMTETGTVRRKPLENKIVDCVVPVEMLFSSDDHGLIYQFEMGEWSEKEVASWFEVANALNLTDLSRITEEVMLMRDVICHPEYDPETKLGDGKKIGDKLRNRASELRVMIDEIDGVARLRAACEAHLRQNAPDKLPLPTW